MDDVLLQTAAVDGFDGEESARDLHDFGGEVVAEEHGVQGGAGDNHFEVFPLGLQLFDQS